MMIKRVMGKASFAKIADRTGEIQLFVQSAAVGAVYDESKTWDVGDALGAEGTLFITKTGELSVKVEKLRLLVKSPAAAAGQVARSVGSRNALSAALRRSHRQPEKAARCFARARGS